MPLDRTPGFNDAFAVRSNGAFRDRVYLADVYFVHNTIYKFIMTDPVDYFANSRGRIATSNDILRQLHEHDARSNAWRPFGIR